MGARPAVVVLWEPFRDALRTEAPVRSLLDAIGAVVEVTVEVGEPLWRNEGILTLRGTNWCKCVLLRKERVCDFGEEGAAAN